MCSTVCADKEEACADWASGGECEKNPASMLTLCPSSCGICQARRRCCPACRPPLPLLLPLAPCLSPQAVAPRLAPRPSPLTPTAELGPCPHQDLEKFKKDEL